MHLSSQKKTALIYKVNGLNPQLVETSSIDFNEGADVQIYLSSDLSLYMCVCLQACVVGKRYTLRIAQRIS